MQWSGVAFRARAGTAAAVHPAQQLVEAAVAANKRGDFERAVNDAHGALAVFAQHDRAEYSNATHLAAHLWNVHIVAAMSLKAMGRFEDAVDHFSEAQTVNPAYCVANPFYFFAVAEALNATDMGASLVAQLVTGLSHRASRDRYWQLLVEALGAFGLWDDAESMLERCVVEGCSFAGHGSWVQHGGPESLEVRDTLLRYHREGRQEHDWQARAAALRSRFKLPPTFNVTNMFDALGVRPFAKFISKMDPWERYSNFHLVQFIHPVPTSFLDEMRHDHAQMVRLLDDPSGKSNETDRVLTVTAGVASGVLQVDRKSGHSVRYGSPFRCLEFPIFDQRDCLVYAKLLARGMTFFMGHQFVLNPPFQHVVPAAPPRVLRVGLFTADLTSHAMIQLLTAFILNRPTVNYHFHIFHSGTDRRRFSGLLRASDNETDVTDMNDWELAQAVHGQKMDVMIDAMGITLGGHFAAFAHWRPAPVQVLFGGYPSTLGSPNVQYSVADIYSVPPEAQSGYTEKMIYLPGTWLVNDDRWFQTSSTMPKRFQKMAPSSTPRFCNLGREWKYDDVTMMHWCSIVRRVPGSTLALVHGIEKLGREPLLRIANVTENISRFFVEQCKLDASRLEFLPRLSWNEYIEQGAELCDVWLDTPNYNAGITAVEALYIGVPLVHRAGGLKMMQRAAGSAIRAAGLADELITYSWQQYCDKAVELVTNQTTSARVRAKLYALREPSTRDSILFRPVVDIGALWAGLREAHASWVRKEEPRHIFTHPLARYANVTSAEYARWFGGSERPPFFVLRDGPAIQAITQEELTALRASPSPQAPQPWLQGQNAAPQPTPREEAASPPNPTPPPPPVPQPRTAGAPSAPPTRSNDDDTRPLAPVETESESLLD